MRHRPDGESRPRRACRRSARCKVYRDFIFARLAEDGVDFETFFGDSLSSIDNMVDRSPDGKLVLEGRTAALHAPLQLEDARREPDRHLPSDGRARSPLPAPRCRSGSASRPRAARSRWLSRSMRRSCRPTTSSRRWACGSGRTATATPASRPRSTPTIRRSPATSTRWSRLTARSGPRPSSGRTATTRLLPQHHGQGADPDAARIQADRRRQDAGRELYLPPRRRSGHAVRAHADVQPADQCADLDRRSRRSRNVRARADGPACPTGYEWVNIQRLYEPGEAEDVTDTAGGTSGAPDAQPVPRLAQVHDDVDEARRRRIPGGGAMSEITEKDLIDFVYREARLLDELRYEEWLGALCRGRALLDAGRVAADRSEAAGLADVRGHAAPAASGSSGSPATAPSARSRRAGRSTCCRRRRSTR